MMADTGKLIVLAAFDRNDEGDLVPAFDPRQVDTEERALREAKLMAGSHAGVAVGPQPRVEFSRRRSRSGPATS